MARKDQIIAALEKQVEAKRTNRLLSWQPYPKQRDFIAATADHNEVAMMAGNQLGKSETGAYVTACHLTGIYPDWWQGQTFDHPTRGWAAGESSVAVRDIQQRKLLGPPGDPSQVGTGMLPRHLIKQTILGHGAGGAIDIVKVAHISGGTSELAFKSYEQGREKFQGATLDFIWWDEEPPLELYLEGIARLIATNGLSFATFTPLNGLNQVVPRFQERTPEAMRDRCIVRMRMADALHLQDPERQKALLATFPSWQRRARIDGLPLLGSGAVFEEVQIEDLIEPITLRQMTPGRLDIVHRDIGVIDTRGWAFLVGMDFGISHAFGAVLLAHDRDRDIVYALAEIKLRDAIPAIHAARIKAIAANVKCVWPHDGHSRDKGSGHALADIYRREGLVMAGTHAQFPDGSISTEAGILEMLTRMRGGRFKIAANLVEWQNEFAGFHRKDGIVQKVNDDLLSATRMGIMSLREARPCVLGGQRALQAAQGEGRGRIAIGAELSGEDLF